MIRITTQESSHIREHFPNVHITVANREHKSKAKTYYMTADKNALRAIVDTNVSARRELLELLENELRYAYRDKSRLDKLKREIIKLKDLG